MIFSALRVMALALLAVTAVVAWRLALAFRLVWPPVLVSIVGTLPARLPALAVPLLRWAGHVTGGRRDPRTRRRDRTGESHAGSRRRRPGYERATLSKQTVPRPAC